MMTPKPDNTSNSKGKRLILQGIGAIFAVALLMWLSKYFGIQDYLQQALQWIESLGPVGILWFISLYVIATVLFVPGTILTLGAGVIFGVVWGSLYVFIGATLGALAAFLVGRYFARNWVENQIKDNSKFQAIDRAVGKEGWKIVGLTRLSPLFPFNLLNYAFGITQVSLSDYTIGSLGMIPGTVAYVYIGALAGNLATLGTHAPESNASGVQSALKILGAIATVAVTIYITLKAKQALDQKISE